MVKLLQNLWERVSNIVFPDDYYAWQTLIYLGIFSFMMSWVARLATDSEVIVNLIATGGWIFFALGIGWLLEENKIRFFGIPVAPWVVGAIVCIYFFNLIPGDNWQVGLVTWPLVSVAIAAAPQFLTWELKPKLPKPPMRQQLILLLLIALLFSNWFQFYFRLQEWFADYPSLLADDFSRSGFVFRMAEQAEGEARGIVLLTSAESEISAALEDTPWPYVERWLLNLDEKLVNLEGKSINSLTAAKERELWQLAAQTRGLEDGSYALDLMAIWSGPTSIEGGYYLEKTCNIRPRSQTQPALGEADRPSQTTQLAEVDCELATPRRPGRPPSILASTT